jgi:MFS family permease
MRAPLTPRLRDGLFIISATMMLGYGSVFALLAVIREQYGFDETAIGLIGGSGFASGFVVQLALSRYADQGHAHRMMQIGLAIASISSLSMVFAEALWQWIAARVLLGIGSGCFAPALRRIAVTNDPAHVGRSLGRLASFELSGFLIGPLLASLLQGWLGLQAPFLAVGLLLAAMAPLLSQVPVQPEARVAARTHVRTLLRRPAIQATLCAGVAFYVTIGVLEAVWAIFMADLGASQLFIGLSLSLFMLPMVFIAPWAGGLAQQKGPLRVVRYSIAVAAACMAIYGGVESLPWLCVALAIHSLADAFTMPAIQLAMARASDEAAIATGQGLLGAVNLSVAASAAIAGGWVYDTFGATVVWQGAGCLMLVLLTVASLRGSELRTGEDAETTDVRTT